MGFGKISSNISLIKDVYSRVKDTQIMNHYFGINEFPVVVKSPLREDNNPSFSIFINEKGRIKYKDLAQGNSGDMIDLLCSYWGVSFQEAVDRVYSDIDKFESDSSVNNSIMNNCGNRRKSLSKETKLECRIRAWNKDDLEYWEAFGISLPWLKFGDIFPISHSIFTKKNNKWIIPAEKYAYAYVERKDHEVSLKIYQPYSESYKWINKHDSSVWDLWDKLPKNGNNLIITSSRKDALCIWENTGIPATSLQAESHMPKKQVISELKNRFKNIYILYDNDFRASENHGEILGRHLCEIHNLKFIQLPTKFMSKDPSDFVNMHGRKALKELIKQILNV